MRRRPTFLSLFAGCGGLDLGFLEAGFRCVGAAEIDPWAVQTYAANFKLAPAQVDLSTHAMSSSDHIDVIVAGPPCQGFSTIGRRAADDPRNDLFLIPVRTAINLRVKCLVLENVPGILSGRGKAKLDTAIRILHRHGYNTRLSLVHAASALLPQLRKRLVLIARQNEALPELALPQPLAVPLRDVLPVPAATPNHEPRPLRKGSRAALIAGHIGRGEKLCNVRAAPTAIHSWNIPAVFGRTTKEDRVFLNKLVHLRRRNRRRSFGDADPVLPEVLRVEFGRSWEIVARRLIQSGYLRLLPDGLIDLTHTFNGKFRRLRPDEPTNCVLTKFCQPEYFLHPFEDRAFTIREAARVQGFPDDFIFWGPIHAQARQVGNAVPPPLATFIAQWIRDRLL